MNYLPAKKYHLLAFLLIFIISTALLHRKSINKLPCSTHAWAQSDHYALAIGFVNNNFDFFHPTTFALSHQFPAKSNLSDPSGITAVDFPLLHYTVALFMKVLGTTSPWVFRLTSILWSFIGLLVLFRTITEIKGIWEAFLIVGFILFQPIYAYYQGGFHVSSAAFNTFLIGASQMLRFHHTGKHSKLVWAHVFLMIAALMRFTQIISLLALVCMHAYNYFKTRKLDKTVFYTLGAILLVLGYFTYNKLLAAKYGTLFLGSPIVASNLTDFINQLIRIAISYARGFLPITQAIVFGSLIYFNIKNRKTQPRLLNNWLIWLSFSFLGTLCFTFLMSWSLSVHDYYSMDTWLPFLTLSLIYLIHNSNFELRELYPAIFIAVFLSASFTVAMEQQYRKYDDNRRVIDADLVIDNFLKSNDFLNSRIAPDKKVMIICGHGWNTPMIGWQRKAFRVAHDYAEQIPSALNRNYDFFITHNPDFESDIVHYFPTFENEMCKVADNGLVSIWVRN